MLGLSFYRSINTSSLFTESMLASILFYWSRQEFRIKFFISWIFNVLKYKFSSSSSLSFPIRISFSMRRCLIILSFSARRLVVSLLLGTLINSFNLKFSLRTFVIIICYLRYFFLHIPCVLFKLMYLSISLLKLSLQDLILWFQLVVDQN